MACHSDTKLLRKCIALFYFDGYSEGMLGRLLIAAATVSAVAMVIILNMTTPASAGAFGILAIFVFAYLIVLTVVTFLLVSLSKLAAVVLGAAGHKPQPEQLSLQKAYYYATIIALAPVIIISMESIGGAGPYELSLIGIFVTIGCLYVSKRTAH